MRDAKKWGAERFLYPLKVWYEMTKADEKMRRWKCVLGIIRVEIWKQNRRTLHFLVLLLIANVVLRGLIPFTTSIHLREHLRP